MVNVCSDLADCFKKSRAVAGTRSSHHFVLIPCNKTAHELTSEDREFLQFDFDKSLTKEIDINNIKVFLYVGCIYNIFWWVGMTEVNVHKGDLKIEFQNPHGPKKTFRWPSVADVLSQRQNMLCIITAPTAICIYKAVIHIWSFLSLGTNGF